MITDKQKDTLINKAMELDPYHIGTCASVEWCRAYVDGGLLVADMLTRPTPSLKDKIA